MLHQSKTSAPTPEPLTTKSWSGYRPPGQSRSDKIVRGAAGVLLARPWFDHLVAMTLKRYFFPLSRLWAAAGVSEGSPEQFFDRIRMTATYGTRDRVLATLARFEQARAKSSAMDEKWDDAFFGNALASVDEAIAIEAARLELRHALGMMRRHFLFLTRNHVPRVNYDTPTPDEVEAIYGPARNDRKPFVSAPEPMPVVEVSKRLPAEAGTDYWLRFPSPSDRLNDMVYARVHEPSGITNPPTIIFGHGVCVEFDHWQGLIDECHTLRQRGIRVIRPEAPWHGRRTKPGRYGGEELIATFPFGPLDMFTGAAREWAVLANWARGTSTGKLAFGGSSLGALTSQFVADCATDWPKQIRPDALFLVTHCGRITDAMSDGQLIKIWGDPSLLNQDGWNAAEIESYLNLLSPGDKLPVVPENIVSVQGSHDVITPFESGQALVQRWGVPEKNLFIWNRGHFTVPMTMHRDDGPIDRLCQILGA